LGINVQTLSGWVTADRDKQARAADPTALSDEDLAELKRLRKENASLREDREILRKAAAYFARETMR
jgi:transposase